MTVLKQRTVRVGSQKQTVGLKKLKNDMSVGGEYKYEVVDLDSGSRFEDPFTNKRDAEREFRETIKHIERGMEEYEADDGGPDVGLGLGSSDDLLDPFDGDDLL